MAEILDSGSGHTNGKHLGIVNENQDNEYKKMTKKSFVYKMYFLYKHSYSYNLLLYPYRTTFLWLQDKIFSIIRYLQFYYQFKVNFYYLS